MLLLASQLPQLPFVPVWVAGFGATLVVLRLALLAHDRRRPDAPPARIPALALVLFALVTAAAIRASFGYFVGRDPCVAFLFVLVGIKYLEAKSARDGTLLVCLSSFLVVTPFFYSQSPLSALAGLPALFVLGATLQALAQRPGAPAPPWRAALRRSGVLMLQGIPLAALLFVLFPRLAAPLWGLPGDTMAQTGLSDRMAPGFISELTLSDAIAFRVDFDGRPPPPPQRYWRGPVFSRFDGTEWTQGMPPGQGRFAPPDGEPVALHGHAGAERQAVAVRARPARRPAAARFGRRGGRRARAAGDADARPAAHRARRGLAAAALPAALAAARELPGDRRRRAGRETAENLRLPSGGNRQPAHARVRPRPARAAPGRRRLHPRRAVASFATSPSSTRCRRRCSTHDPVDVFLFDTRRGFCEHYASAFVVLLRAAGIPARVVTGYQGGEINPRGGYLIVRQSDAHAWAEALIDGRWQRFDPTAAVAPSRIETGTGRRAAVRRAGAAARAPRRRLVKQLQLTWDAVNHDWRRNVVGFNHDRQRSLWRDWQLDRLPGWQLAGGAMLVVAAWLGIVLGWLVWRRRRADRAHTLWETACAQARARRVAAPSARGPARLRRARRGALARVRRRLPRHRRLVRGAALRRGGVRPDDDRQRAAALATLARAIDVLPAPAALRAPAPPARAARRGRGRAAPAARGASPAPRPGSAAPVRG